MMPKKRSAAKICLLTSIIRGAKMINCDYCGVAAQVVTGKFLYPRRPDLAKHKFWYCEDCQAWVGCHHNDIRQPKGRLANAELRKMKMAAHRAFDPIWMNGSWKGSRSRKRGKAYRMLADKMGITVDKCHIGMFNLDQCRKVIDICRRKI